MLALGLIETRGFLPAIEGADAMLKAAEVRLLEKNFVGGGLVTITIAGEVSAVRASVDAAVAAIKRIPGALLISEHVIARPDEELTRILCFEAAQDLTQNMVQESTIAASASMAPMPASDLEADKAQSYDLAHLKNMSLNRLRQLARSLAQNPAQHAGGLSLTQEEIATADKKALIEAITAASKQIKE